jgi:hypothetical protein
MKTPSFADYNIPQHTQGALKRYVEHGYMPGGFLTAVLCNDLVRAVCRADHMNQACLADIVKWVYNSMPMAARGSEDNMMNWCRAVQTELAKQDLA